LRQHDKADNSSLASLIDHRNNMNTTLWIALGVAVLLVVGYLLVMRIFYRQSRELDKQIDYSKIKKMKDDEDKD
jgi:low affinity Fe/Cu permease